MSHHHLEESSDFSPQFDTQGLLPVIVIDSQDKAVLMLAYVNQESIQKTIATGLAHYFSRSRGRIWKKGEESGFVQKVQNIFVDCDQDTLIFEVEQVGGAACHTGRKSCFYRKIDITKSSKSEIQLQMHNSQRIFDPSKTYSKK
jgi:phosphoribosyl-AMP cyclohydrolase